MDTNLLNEAMNPDYNPGPRSVFGQINSDVWACALVKGQGKVPFDPVIHGAEERQVAIDIRITPLASAPRNEIIKREMIANSAEWAKTVLPSIKALGRDLAGLENAWVRAELVPTRTYTARDGSQKQATTFKFIEIYADEAACEAAAAALFRRASGPADGMASQSTSNQPQPAVGGMSRETAYTFLKMMWAQSTGDPNVFVQKIAANPAVSAHFPPDCEEVAALALGVAA